MKPGRLMLCLILVMLIQGQALAFWPEIGHDRSVIIEYNKNEGPVMAYESVLTIKVSSLTLGAIIGPEYTVNQGDFRWISDLFFSGSKWTLGVNWGKPSGPKVYAMYSF